MEKLPNLKIAFFGTSDRSLPILDSLNSNFYLVLVVTKTDRKIGRKQTIKSTAVKDWTLDKNIPLVELDKFKEGEAEKIVALFREYDIDYGIVADFSYIVPKELCAVLYGKLINIHFSLLPKYRGASPVQYAILSGDKSTGVTLQLLNFKIDSGDILQTIEYPISSKATSGELYKKLFEISAEKLPKILAGYYSGDIRSIKQDPGLISYTYSRSHNKNTFIYKEDAKIDWKNSSVEIERAIRAFNPWPIAWTTIEDLNSQQARSVLIGQGVNKKFIGEGHKIVKIYEADVVEGKLKPITIQLEGKTKTDWESFLNGYYK
ncbi:hypothetical protein A2450_00415 [candidate division WWE3 bacterium RIFOXYC2_FULL_40_11]|nr:MAG: hypothetical protein A2450_00415 [candidate division WWE3 bacterium RIFOXYC2_FULL_40_11]